MDQCERKGKWIGGCKFEPRFEEAPYNTHINVKGTDAEGMRSLMFYEVYVRDVCTTCGKTIERKAHHAD